MSAIFYLIFISHQMIALQRLWMREILLKTIKFERGLPKSRKKVNFIFFFQTKSYLMDKVTKNNVLILIMTSQICWIVGWLKIQKLEWISWEQDETFLQNEIIINLCLRSHILTSYLFVAELTFKETFEKIKVSNITYMDSILTTNTEESITERSKIRWKQATWNQWEN